MTVPLLGCLGEQYSNRNPSSETQAFLLLLLGKGGTPYGLYFDRDYCENTTSPLGKGALDAWASSIAKQYDQP